MYDSPACARMTIRDRLDADLREALRTGDAPRASTLTLTRAVLRNAELERGRTLTDTESAAQREQLELAILLGYVPRSAAGGRTKTGLGRRR